MTKTNFYTDDQLPAIGAMDYPAKFNTLMGLIQGEFEARWQWARGFYEVPGVTLDAAGRKVDLCWPGGKGALLGGVRLATAGSWAFAGSEASGTYYLQLDAAGLSKALTEDAARLTVATVRWTAETQTLEGLALSALAANTGGCFAGMGGTGGGTLLQPRGAWQADYPYTGTAGQRDVVEHNGSGYLCLQSHSAGAVSEPGAGAAWATYWQVLAAQGRTGSAAVLTPRGTWLAGQNYAVNDAVCRGNGYACRQAHTAAAENAPDGPGGTGYWEKIVDQGAQGVPGGSAYFNLLGAWAANLGALVNDGSRIDLVTHTLPRAGTLYRVLQSHTAEAGKEPGTAGGAGYFAVMIPAPEPAALGARRGPWAAGTAYAANDVVSNMRGTWWAKDAHVAGGADEPGVGLNYAAHWEAIALAVVGPQGAPGTASTVPGPTGPAGRDADMPVPAGVWQGTVPYPHLAIVRYNGWTFIARQASTGQAPDTTADTAYWMRLLADGSGVIDVEGEGTLQATRRRLDFHAVAPLTVDITDDDANDKAVVNLAVNLTTAIGTPGSDLHIPSEKAVRTAIAAVTPVAPVGGGLNYALACAVAGNTLVVTLTGADGNALSAGNVARFGIGGAQLAVSAPLAVTLPAVDLFAWDAGKIQGNDAQLFVYLINNNGAPQLGLSPCPVLRTIAGSYRDDAGQTGAPAHTNLAMSGTRHATNTCQVIGRIQVKQADNDAWVAPAVSQLLNQPITETDWLAWTPAYTGFAVTPTPTYSRYKVQGSDVLLTEREMGNGTSNATTFTMTAPIWAKSYGGTTMLWVAGLLLMVDNGAIVASIGSVYIMENTNSVCLQKIPGSGPSWTSSSGKRASFSGLRYEVS